MNQVEKIVGTVSWVERIHFNAHGGGEGIFSRRRPPDCRECQWNILCITCGPQHVAVAPNTGLKKSSGWGGRECLVRIAQHIDISGVLWTIFGE
jgi:hypothetical protein